MNKRLLIAVFALVLTAAAFAQAEDDFTIVQLPDNTVRISGYNGSVKDVIIPEKLYGLPVTVIGSRAFRDKGLTSVTFPNSVTRIEAEAFERNSTLTRVTFGSGLKMIGESAFSGTNLGELILPDSATNLHRWAFQSSGLTKITLPAGIQTISSSCFQSNKLTEITLPASLKRID